MSIGHTGAYRGKQVIVFKRDGSQVRGRFFERSDRMVFLDGGAVRIEKRDIRCVSQVKGGSK